MDSLECQGGKGLVQESHLPIVGSANRFGEDGSNVDDLHSAVGRLHPVGLVDRVGHDELFDREIFQVLHGRLGQQA
jgi:hypothetical protein